MAVMYDSLTLKAVTGRHPGWNLVDYRVSRKDKGVIRDTKIISET